MTIPQLRDELKEAGVEAESAATKPELVALVEQLREVPGDVLGEEEQTFEAEHERAEQLRHLPAVRAAEAMVTRGEVTPDEVAAQRDKIRQVMEAVMKDGVHYGKVPGVSKPTLLKPGAEVLAVTFRFAPHYDSERTFHDDGHLTVVTKVTLTHIPTSLVIAEGEGLCTSREKKYAYRSEGRTCPACGAAAIKKSKFPPRETDYPGARRNDPPGWYCHGKVGGCNANYRHDDPAIIGQDSGRVANPDLADVYNTVLKMAAKRALVAAILNGTAASDIFTQDAEDSGAAAASAEESRYGPFEERRVEQDWAAPTTWVELTERMAKRLGADEAPEWMTQAILAATGTEKDALTTDQRALAFQKLAGVLYALETDTEYNALDIASREAIQGAFARYLDGYALEGPPWRLGPEQTEEGRPIKGQTDLAGEQSDDGLPAF